MKPTDKMSLLIASQYKMLLVMSRFGIPLGFGDKTIDEVCKENNIDVDTFLVVVDLLLDNIDYKKLNQRNISPNAIVNYLEKSHAYFLEFRLPRIREKLSDILDKDKNELSKAIMYYFDEYVSEVDKHMSYENKVVFPYIKSLIDNDIKDNYNIEVFVNQHNHVESRMTEFKSIIIKYYPSKSSNEMNSVLLDIFACEEDLAAHIDIEDKLLVPIIKKLEQTKS